MRHPTKNISPAILRADRIRTEVGARDKQPEQAPALHEMLPPLFSAVSVDSDLRATVEFFGCRENSSRFRPCQEG
jgi:hypothetical protein